MTTLFLTAAVVGAVVVLLQLVLGVAGADHDDAGDHGTASDGLQLFSVRALAAGAAFFGLGGLAAVAAGWPAPVALLAAVPLGAVATGAVAFAMRAMLRLERDATVRIEGAVGEAATVYVPIPPSLEGAGKVHLTLRGRTMEYQAVTSEGRLLLTGTAVIVVDVRDQDTVEVVPLPSLDGVA